MSAKKWEASRAVQLLEKVITDNPANEDAKVAQAICYTEGTGETMKGVVRLREVVNTNPKHEMATLMLGKLAITSGQFDKAKERLSGLIENYPKNPEGYYYLAIAEKSLGNNEKAKELLQKCKSMVKDPEFGKEIDNFLKTF
jgi:predicted Zn-dependent protease